MDKKLKKRWVKWLRSGRYDQGREVLVRETPKGDKFCCLGVLCDLMGVEFEFKQRWNHYGVDFEHPSTGYIGTKDYSSDSTLTPELYAESGLTEDDAEELMELNDGGKSFKYIADFIEKSDI